MSTTAEALSDVLESTQRPSPMPSVDHAGRAAQPRRATAALAPSRCWRRDAGRRLARRCRARSALPLKALRRRRRRLYCERGGRGVGCVFSSSGDPFFCFYCISYLPFKTSRAHAYMLQPEQNRGCNHKTHGVAIGARFGRIGCARPIFCGEASGPSASGCARPTRGWMRDRPEWAWLVFVGRGGGRCFCGLCNCYINCTLLHFSIAVCIYIVKLIVAGKLKYAAALQSLPYANAFLF